MVETPSEPDQRTRHIPAELGFRMPAEWGPHRATWVAWPHNADTWPSALPGAQAEFVELVRVIAAGELVCVVAAGEALQQARKNLAGIQQVEFFDIPTNDAWIRDYGPTFVVNAKTRELAAVDWQYNGWGEKYPPFDEDRRVAQRIAQACGVRRFSSDWVVEGGALEINDRGDLLSTISCLLNPNRNPVPAGRSDGEASESHRFDAFQERLSQELSGMCGAPAVIWISGAELEGDDTDGHIDQQVRFVEDDLLVLATGYAGDDPQHVGLRETLGELRHALATPDRSLQGIDLPLPRPIFRNSQRLPASYLNFYMCNRGVIVPQFNDFVADLRAIELLRSLLPDREVIGLSSCELVRGLGSFHCLTQQEPAV